MKLILVLFSLILAVSFSFTQEIVAIDVITKDFKTDKKDGGVTIKIYEGTTLVSTQTSSSSGKVFFEAKPDKKYKVEASKAGKVTRYINVNTKGITTELLPANTAAIATFSLGLFDEIPGVDFSYVTNNPTTEFYFDGQNPVLQYDDVLAKKMSSKIEKLLKDANEGKDKAEADYNAAIKQADVLFKSSKYTDALPLYEKALGIKPKDKYAGDQLLLCDGFIKAAKAAGAANAQAEQEYQNLITAANALRDQKKYEEAISRYNEALTKKQEQYPKDEITKCEAAIIVQKKEAENAKKYTDAITAGDSFFKQNSFMSAKDKYKEALKFKAGDSYATGKLAEIDKKIDGQKADQERKKKYEDAVAAGEALLEQEKWIEAKAKFNEALTFESAATLPGEKIKEIDAKLAEIEKAKGQQAQITKLLTEGNTAFEASQWLPSKTKYQEVLKLDSKNAAAIARIAAIDIKIQEEKDNAGKSAKIKQLVAEGDALVKQTKLAEAKAKYVEAVGLKPDGAVQVKIDAIDSQLDVANQKAKQKENYDKAMAAAEALFTERKWMDSKAKFQEALAIDPSQAQPKKRILEIDKNIASDLANSEKSEKYLAAFNAGKGALSAKDLSTAKTKFQEAIALDGTKQEAKDKLAEVEKLLADEAKTKQNQAKYDAAMKAGEDLQTGKKLVEAKAKYQEASNLDPAQALPKQKMADIDKLLAAAETGKQVAILLKDGQTAFDKKDLGTARTKYESVLKLDSGNTIASAKLQDIAKLENDLAGAAEKEAKFKKLKEEAAAFMGDKKYQEAKQKLTETKVIKADAGIDQLIKDCDAKIAELAKASETDTKYNALLADAQGLESAKKYDEAIAKYNEALKVKNEQLPKDRIAAINTLKAGNANQAKLDADYTAAMKKGDEAFGAKNYLEAIKFYNQASGLKPMEKIPVDKAAEAQRLETAKTAGTEDAAYNKILDVASKAMEEKNYTKAKEMYNRALGFRANDPFPKQKLADIDALLKAEEDLKKKNTDYLKKLAEAETAAKGGKLENAIALFEQAKTIKPDETVPPTRIAELQALLDGKSSAATEIERKYKVAMTAGNSAETGKDFNKALASYKDALSVKPADKPAQDKIAEMQQILDNAAKGNKLEAEIKALIAEADGKFNKKDWLNAKNTYDRVLGLDASNNYSMERIKLCQKELDKLTIDNEGKEYNKIIAKADEKFGINNYDGAKDLYKRALTFRPNDPYPKKKLDEIDAILNPAPVVVSKEPNALDTLGILTQNSIPEGQNRLQEAEVFRKAKRNRKFRNEVDKTTAQDAADAAKQNEKTTQNNLTLENITTQNNEIQVESDEGRQKIVKELEKADIQLENQSIASQNFETAENLDARNQINTINIENEATETKGTAVALENSDILIQSQVKLTNEQGVTNNDEYQTQINDDTKFTEIKIKTEAQYTDDINERIAAESFVKDARNSTIVIADLENTKDKQEIAEMKEQVDEVNRVGSVTQYENTKQAPLNKEKVLELEELNLAVAKKENEDLLETTLTVKKGLEKLEGEVSKATEKNDDSRKENVEQFEEGNKTLEEAARQDYNSLVIKTLASEKALKGEAIKREEQFSGVTEEANSEIVEKLKVLNDDRQAASTETKKIEQEKHESNQDKLDVTNQKTAIAQTVGSEQAKNNETTLKATNDKLLASGGNQQAMQEKKNQDSRQLLAALEKKEIVYNEQVANDLGKLYPEGVSQEQFEQNDSDGLVEAIVTRRVVVKSGHGSIYIRTQTLRGITYSKNGQPSTEAAWQRETQDAQLVRNY